MFIKINEYNNLSLVEFLKLIYHMFKHIKLY